MAIIYSLLGTDYLPDFKGKILFIEDVGEALYSIDRMMNALRLNGILDKISGQYAFVIYDKISEESFIARDPSGISPMFYTLHDKRIIIGSTVKSILSINCKNFKLYKPAIVDFFLSDSAILPIFFNCDEINPFLPNRSDFI